MIDCYYRNDEGSADTDKWFESDIMTDMAIDDLRYLIMSDDTDKLAFTRINNNGDTLCFHVIGNMQTVLIVMAQHMESEESPAELFCHLCWKSLNRHQYTSGYNRICP